MNTSLSLLILNDLGSVMSFLPLETMQGHTEDVHIEKK